MSEAVAQQAAEQEPEIDLSLANKIIDKYIDIEELKAFYYELKEHKKTRKYTKIITCPLCGGNFDYYNMNAQKHDMMATLVKSGFGYRAIGRLTGEHPQTVKYWSNRLTQLSTELNSNKKKEQSND